MIAYPSDALSSRSYTASQSLGQRTSEAGSPKCIGEGNDPTLSAGQVDNALKGGNAGDNLDPTPTSEQVGDFDPANQHENSQNIPPTLISPEGPNNSPAAGGSGDDNDGAAPGLGLNVVLQDSSYSPKSSKGTVSSPLPYKSVVLASPTAFVVSGNTIIKATNRRSFHSHRRLRTSTASPTRATENFQLCPDVRMPNCWSGTNCLAPDRPSDSDDYLSWRLSNLEPVEWNPYPPGALRRRG